MVFQIEFKGEEGTGLGPTLEFYALVAAELQKKSLGIWLCDDEFPDDQSRPVRALAFCITTDSSGIHGCRQVTNHVTSVGMRSLFQIDIGRGVKPAGYYVQRSCGLFPSPLPQDTSDIERVEKRFFFMGTFFAKCIQDSRLVDIPLSRPLLKLMCGGDVVDNVSQNYRELLTRLPSEEFGGPDSGEVTPTEDMDKELILDPPKHKLRSQTSMTASLCAAPWYAGLLNHGDFELVDPHRARFLQQLRDLAARKQAVLSNYSLTEEEKHNRVQQLTIGNPPVKLEDLR